jgi:RNA polymerase sigma-70 factor (ECF subfamily)
LTEISTLQTIKRWLWREQEYSISDADVFAHLYDQNHLTVFRYVYGLSGGPQQDVEDITAETFTRAWVTRHRFTGNEQAALGWLLHIARNLVIDSSRRNKVHAVDENVNIESLLDVSALPEADVVTREQAEILWNMLISLPEDTREMLVLRYLLGWQVKQIASHLDMTENNVSVRIRRALNSLQRNWPQS